VAHKQVRLQHICLSPA